MRRRQFTSAAPRTASTGPSRLTRVSLMKDVLQAFRARLDEQLQPLGITSAQLRLLWVVSEHPRSSGANVARLCSLTPQTVQAALARLEANGWVRRRTSAESERVLLAEVTASGRRVLERARIIAERLDAAVWSGQGRENIGTVDRVLNEALQRLSAR